MGQERGYACRLTLTGNYRIYIYCVYLGCYRFKRLGLSSQARILILVYSHRRLKNGQETFRIIAARRASWKERKAYEA